MSENILIYNHVMENREMFIENKGFSSILELGSFHWNILSNEKNHHDIKKIDMMENMSLPKGWSGPFNGYYLAKNATSRSYKSLAEAIEGSSEYPECKGITRDRNGVFKLRVMVGGYPIKTTRNDTSWVKGEIQMEDE